MNHAIESRRVTFLFQDSDQNWGCVLAITCVMTPKKDCFYSLFKILKGNLYLKGITTKKIKKKKDILLKRVNEF